jgi:hypothetical protein
LDQGSSRPSFDGRPALDRDEILRAWLISLDIIGIPSSRWHE